MHNYFVCVTSYLLSALRQILLDMNIQIVQPLLPYQLIDPKYSTFLHFPEKKTIAQEMTLI